MPPTSSARPNRPTSRMAESDLDPVTGKTDIALFRRQRRHELYALPYPLLQRLVRRQSIGGNHDHAPHWTTGEVHFACVWLRECHRILFRADTHHQFLADDPAAHIAAH